MSAFAVAGLTVSPMRVGNVRAQAGTPAAQLDDVIEVRLAPGLGNEWCVYNGQLGPEALASVGEVTIANVRNSTEKGVVVIHWDQDGSRVGPVSVAPGAVSDEFNGMSLSGVWEAHVGGSATDAPQRVTLEVTYHRA